jgi:hypothetical protein
VKLNLGTLGISILKDGRKNVSYTFINDNNFYLDCTWSQANKIWNCKIEVIFPQFVNAMGDFKTRKNMAYGPDVKDALYTYLMTIKKKFFGVIFYHTNH